MLVIPWRSSIKTLQSEHQTRAPFAASVFRISWLRGGRTPDLRSLEVVRDAGNSVAVFNQNVAVRAPDTRPIRRIGIQDQLVAWWTDTSSEISRSGTGCW